MPVPDLSDRSLTELVSLRGRTAVITGGARGLGLAIARRLAEAGASVAIGDLDEAAAKHAAAQIADEHDTATVGTALDVTDSASMTTFAETATSALGEIGIWVNNAGIFPSSPLTEVSDEEWDRVLAVNLRGVFAGCREAARQLGDGGVIVNLASVAGLRGRGPGVAAYAASKHGVVGLTRQVGVELAPRGIRVLGIAPTTIITPGVEESMAKLGTSPDKLEAALTRPLGRAGRPDDVARVVLFAASDLAAFMTGSVLVVDAGELAS